MFYVGEDEERFIGFVNQGDTVGQSSFLFEVFENDIRIVADISNPTLRCWVGSRRVF